MFLQQESIDKLTKLAESIKKDNPKLAADVENIIKEAMGSLQQTIKSELIGHMETAYQKYFQIIMMSTETCIHHWRGSMKASLVHFLNANTASHLKKGFVFSTEQIKQWVPEARDFGFDQAFEHLDELKMSYQDAYYMFYRDVPLEELFNEVNITLPIWKKYMEIK